MATANLIKAASERLLSNREKAQLTRGLWKGTAEDFRLTVNRAYAMAKRYDETGGADLLQELDHLFLVLGSSDFRVLYLAAKIS